MDRTDRNKVITRYTERFQLYGDSPKTLGWDKGKQDIRYETLLSLFELEGKSILDIGCGFGDANRVIAEVCSSYQYLGVDIVDVLINSAVKKYDFPNVCFVCDDFLEHQFTQKFDIIIASGVFNFKLENSENIDFITRTIDKAFSLANEGVSFDFLSDKVDYQLDHTFHSNPSKILEVFYEYTRNLVLINNVMPFEFAVTGFVNQKFDTSDTLFSRYKNAR